MKQQYLKRLLYTSKQKQHTKECLWMCTISVETAWWTALDWLEWL